MHNLTRCHTYSRGVIIFSYMKTNQGFIKWIIIIVIALIILSYYGFDVREAIESPTTQKNFNYVQQIVWNVWNNYLKDAVIFVWGIIVKAFNNISS